MFRNVQISSARVSILKLASIVSGFELFEFCHCSYSLFYAQIIADSSSICLVVAKVGWLEGS